MDRHDRLGTVRDQGLRRADVDAVRLRIDVGEDGHAAGEQGGGCRRLEGVGGDDDFGAGLDTHRLKGHFKGDRTVRDAQGVG